MSTAAEESQDTLGSFFDDSQSQDTPGSSLVDTQEPGKKKKQAKKGKQPKAKLQTFTHRDPVMRRVIPPAGKSFTVLSWNVNGIRATAKKGLEVLRGMVKEERPDLICFQETKIQQKDVEDESLRLRELLPGYDSQWNCSTAKLGYSGTAVFFPKQEEAWVVEGGAKENSNGSASGEPAKKKMKQGKISSFFSATPKPEKQQLQPPAKDAASTRAPAAQPQKSSKGAVGEGDGEGGVLPGGRSGLKVLGVRFGVGGGVKHNNQGRSITVEYEQFFVVTVYVPNSGEKCARLDYRVKEWDPVLRAYVSKLEAEGKPVVVNGDFNVAHLDLDIYNRGAPHLPKSSGTTKEERESFDAWVKDGKVVDAFRRFHPEAEGAYTYWSVRTGARPLNRGLRLDYFVCSASLFEDKKKQEEGGKGSGSKAKRAAAGAAVVDDCFILDKATVGLSDHCPVGITLRLA